MSYIQHPKSGKYLTVGDLEDMVAKLKMLEVPKDTLLSVQGVTGWHNELRGLGVKESKKT